MLALIGKFSREFPRKLIDKNTLIACKRTAQARLSHPNSCDRGRDTAPVGIYRAAMQSYYIRGEK